MRHAFMVAALGGIASASPLGRLRHFLGRRDACDVQPPGAIGAPVPSPNTPQGFLASPDFASLSTSAETPQGYEQVYENIRASNK